MKPKWLLYMFAALSGTIVRSASAPANVAVTITPAKIQRHTFDLKHPPSNMPKLTPSEAGVCRSEFNCEMESHVAAAQTGTGAVTAKFSSTRITTYLTIDVWTPINGPAKITAHEEAHREICEHYYQRADEVAHRLGQRALATPVHLNSLEPDGLKSAVRKMQDPIIAQFMRDTAQRCSFAQDRFDAITNHSLNPIDEPAAIAEALAEETARFQANHKS